MSAKDAFFKKLEENTKAQNDGQEAYKRDVTAFQEDAKALILEVKGWFDGSGVTANMSTSYVTENTDRFEVANLTLKNGDKTLKITPEGLYYFGVTGSLEVIIQNPRQAPNSSKFNLHWRDEISKLSGWVIVSGGVAKASVQRVPFSQESFFNMITAFA